MIRAGATGRCHHTPGTRSAGASYACATKLTRPLDELGEQFAGTSPKRNTRNDRVRAVAVGADVPRREWICPDALRALAEVHVLVVLDHPAEHGLVGVHVVTAPNCRMDVPVLGDDSVTVIDEHLETLGNDDPAVPDRVDGRGVGDGDVDAEMEREVAATAHEASHRRLSVEARARITEVGAHRMGLPEGLHGPAVRVRRVGRRCRGRIGRESLE